MSSSKYYTGVGSRQTPPDVLALMTRIATKLREGGFILRSGGAQGADSAFTAGAGKYTEIWRPEHCTPMAEEIASRYHPVWNRLTPYVKKLHGRNVFQVLGGDLATPSEFLICWTPDGCVSHGGRSIQTGGTGTAISIASEYGVQVNNLAIPQHRVAWETYLLIT
jgi:hypothetical protein